MQLPQGLLITAFDICFGNPMAPTGDTMANSFFGDID